MLEDSLREAPTIGSYKYIRLNVGCIMLLIFLSLFERCYIGIKAPISCTLVFWVLLLLCCMTFVFQVGERIKLILRRKEMSWLFLEV